MLELTAAGWLASVWHSYSIRSCDEIPISIGAGRGGFTVSLVAEDKVSQFIEKVRRSYGPFTRLNDRGGRGHIRDEAE